MALPEFSMRQLLEAGVHFGHQTHRWNPKMAPYIYGARSHIHILDLSQTVPLLHQALVVARNAASKGGRILFVGTKRAASEPIAQAAQRSAQYFVNHRWLGGMLTNWSTISKSISRLRELESLLDAEEGTGLTKKETLKLTRECERLEKSLGGIKNMGGKPDLMFVIDTNKESIAIKEARRLGIPVIAILDTNCNPGDADYPIPGNDDAARAINLYCDLMADAILDGMTEAQSNMGVDLGAAENPVELALDAAPTAAPEAKVEDPAKAALKVEKVEKKTLQIEKSSEKPAASKEPTEIDSPKEPAPAKPAEKVAEKVEVKSEPKKAATPDKPADKKSVKSTAKEAGPVPSFVDDIALIDGVGPTYKKRLEEAGIKSLKQIAELDETAIAKLNDELNLRGQIASGEWIEQAKEMLAGKPPRAKIDQAAAAKKS